LLLVGQAVIIFLFPIIPCLFYLSLLLFQFVYISLFSLPVFSINLFQSYEGTISCNCLAVGLKPLQPFLGPSLFSLACRPMVVQSSFQHCQCSSQGTVCCCSNCSDTQLQKTLNLVSSIW
jgi:hypothetical protein